MKIPGILTMKEGFLVAWILMLLFSKLQAQVHLDVIPLNGVAGYEQTELAFPPSTFNHKIQVPGLIDLAEPRLAQYDNYFSGKQDLKYHWYRFTFKVPEGFRNKFATLTLMKSMYNTHIILNGYDCGTFMQCTTPIETNLTAFLKYNNEENVLLISVDEEKRIPRESALGFDREKFAYIPGIWDDILISFTGPVRVARTLILPEFKKKQVTVKLRLENLSKVLQRNMEYAYANYSLTGFIKEKKTGKRLTDDFIIQDKIRSQMEVSQEIIVPVKDPVPWSPENPFLYQLVLSLKVDSITIDKYGNPENKAKKYPGYLTGVSDVVTENIGIRDLSPLQNYFTLNGNRYFLTGSTITLNRFFEDRDRKALPWDKEWVRKMFIEIPKALGWNTMRICIGLLPDFWYDLADEYGIMLQNEYPMWQLRGSNSEMEKEYTDWVWADGSHPSIVIWDALNEQKSDFIGNRLIPELLKLDPTRIWDAGYMTAKDMKIQMQESHPYRGGFGWWNTDKSLEETRNKYIFGTLTFPDTTRKSSIPVLVNEYGWLWQTRDGTESGIRVHGNFLPGQETPYTDDYEYYEPGGEVLYKDRDIYDYYLGKGAAADERYQFQTYMTGLETEALRTSKRYCGILSFAYLANNRGYTGDWFMNNIADLKPSQALLIQYHTSKLFAVFIDQKDHRYNRKKDYFEPGSSKKINLFATNESGSAKSGKIILKLIDAKGKAIPVKTINVELTPYSYRIVPVTISIPKKTGGYAIVTELTDFSEKESVMKQVSIRYVRVGNIDNPEYYNYTYTMP